MIPIIKFKVKVQSEVEESEDEETGVLTSRIKA